MFQPSLLFDIMSFLLFRPLSSMPHNIFCHISVTIVYDFQTCARHTGLLVINSLPLQLSKFFFFSVHLSRNELVNFCCPNKEVKCWTCKALFGFSLFISIQDWLLLLFMWQSMAGHGCSMSRGGPSASWQNVKQQRKG